MWIAAHRLAIPSGTNHILKKSIVYIFTDIHIVGDLHLGAGVNQWSSEFIQPLCSAPSLPQLAFPVQVNVLIATSVAGPVVTATHRQFKSAVCSLAPNVLKNPT